MMRVLTALHGTRESSTGSIWHNAWKTLLQVVIIWGLFLVVIPRLIVRIEMLLAVPNFDSTKWEVLGMLLFMAMSTVGLMCAFLFVWYGKGTPLPLDTATRFVVMGPYRYVRNPMAISGLGQGMGAALALGSYGCLVYVGLGAVVWNQVARPWEEEDLLRRFGENYEHYRSKVRCWIPTWRPYPATVVDHEEDSDSFDCGPSAPL